MPIVTCDVSISLDGFLAGPNQRLEKPIGEGGLRLHQWMFETAAWRTRQGSTGGDTGVDSNVVEHRVDNVGAYIMGRNMFSPGRGSWDQSWRGWWGEDPPYHVPVFVLTHHPRGPLEMRGGTTFHFVTEGVHRALELAREAAGKMDVQVAGGASTIQQLLRADLLDELTLHLVPVLLGSGERLLEEVGDPVFQVAGVIESPRVTHLTYRIAHRR